MKLTKERPIIFNTEMVKAILDGRKTQTRRVIKPQPDYSILKKGVTLEPHKCPILGPVHLGRKEWGLYRKPYQPTAVPCFAYDCLYGKIGDHLWVKETYCLGNITEADSIDGHSEGCYVSQCPDENNIIPKEYCIRHEITTNDVIWKPSIFMPRKLSRIDLEITDRRVERVQDIKPEDCEAEGIWGETKASPINGLPYEIYHYQELEYPGPVTAFHGLWDSINAKRGYGWEVNSWVWAVTFKVLKKEV